MNKKTHQNPLWRRLEPSWHDARCFRRAAFPVGLSEWLFEQGSMTRRVQKVCREDFFVRVLAQSWRCPQRTEVGALGLPPNKRAVVREVELVGDGEALISARSVFPEATLRGKGRLLNLLGDRPLVELLFSDPTLMRSTFELALLYPGHMDYERALKHVSERPPVLWARRSIFRLYGGPLLVCEIFLPTIGTLYCKG